MPNNYFRFKQFIIDQAGAAFKVGTDSVLLGACADLTGASKILEIGAGTALISIMAAQRSEAEIVTIEPHPESYNQAQKNVLQCKWSKRIKIVKSDFQSFHQDTNEKFDLIITNPPWFRDSLKNPDVTKSFIRHSESLSSVDILRGASKLIRPEGSLQLILPYAEGNIFIAEASDYCFFCTRIIKIKAIPTGEIKRLILKFERSKKSLKEKFLTIETGVRHQYTEEYKEVTKDFYLKF
jgi:tRNA1Val (adenine37-N6)-methyltransferase